MECIRGVWQHCFCLLLHADLDRDSGFPGTTTQRSKEYEKGYKSCCWHNGMRHPLHYLEACCVSVSVHVEFWMSPRVRTTGQIFQSAKMQSSEKYRRWIGLQIPVYHCGHPVDPGVLLLDFLHAVMCPYLQTFFYVSIACISYAAFGDSSPGNLLSSFGFFEPYWYFPLALLLSRRS